MDKQYLAELMKLSEEINQAIYAELLSEGVVRNTIDNIKNLPNTNVPAVLKKKYNELAPVIKKAIMDRTPDLRANYNMAVKDPVAWVKANPGNAAKAGGAALAGVAGVAGTLYAAKKAAERRGWMKNGCASILDPSKKAKCQAYLATKKK